MRKRPPDQELMSVRDAAAIIGVHPSTIRRWAADGRLPAFRVGPQALRVREVDVRGMVHEIPTTGTAQ